MALLTYPRHYRPIFLTFNYRLSSSSCLHFIKYYFNPGHLHLQPGIRGLYAGTVPSLVANVAENAVLFLAYGAAQNLVSRGVGKQQKELNTLENACAGSLASIVSGEY